MGQGMGPGPMQRPMQEQMMPPGFLQGQGQQGGQQGQGQNMMQQMPPHMQNMQEPMMHSQMYPSDSEQGATGEPEPDEYMEEDEMPAPPRVTKLLSSHQELDIENFGMNNSNKSWIDTIIDALKYPLIVAVLYMMIASPQVSKLL